MERVVIDQPAGTSVLAQGGGSHDLDDIREVPANKIDRMAQAPE